MKVFKYQSQIAHISQLGIQLQIVYKECNLNCESIKPNNDNREYKIYKYCIYLSRKLKKIPVNFFFYNMKRANFKKICLQIIISQ